jgi:hypothetical protein
MRTFCAEDLRGCVLTCDAGKNPIGHSGALCSESAFVS